MSSLQTMRLVEERLCLLGVRATMEYPGCIHVIRPHDVYWIFGDVNETWGGDRYVTTGAKPESPESTVNTMVPSTSEDHVAITDAILEAVGVLGGFAGGLPQELR